MSRLGSTYSHGKPPDLTCDNLQVKVRFGRSGTTYARATGARLRLRLRSGEAEEAPQKPPELPQIPGGS